MTNQRTPPEVMVRETRDRVRRIETRLSRFIDAQGFDLQGIKPEWHDGEHIAVIKLPSPNCALKDVLQVIPHGFSGDVDLMVGDDYLVSLYHKSVE